MEDFLSKSYGVSPVPTLTLFILLDVVLTVLTFVSIIDEIMGRAKGRLKFLQMYAENVEFSHFNTYEFQIYSKR